MIAENSDVVNTKLFSLIFMRSLNVIIELAAILCLCVTQVVFAQQIEEVQELQCRLEHCWSQAFPQIQQLIEQGVTAVETYRQGYVTEMQRTGRINPGEADRDQVILEYRLEILRRYLTECETLRDGPQRARHLIIIGHAFTADGANERLAGLSVYHDRLNEVCGPEHPTRAYARCRRSIVILEDTNKQDLAAFLALLGRSSIRSLTYTGHGIESALVLGPKDLLLPVNWSENLTISRSEWRRRNLGMFYSRDAVALAPLLQRVMAPRAPVTLYACNTGQEFAPVLRHILNRSTVVACLVPMHYEYLDSEGQWQTDWNNPVPAGAARTRIVPDVPDMFRPVEAALPLDEATPSAPQGEPQDQATRDILLRLAIGATREATLGQPDRQSVLVFSDAELSELRAITSNVVQGRHIAPDYALNDMNRDFERALLAPNLTDQRRAVITRLQQKVHECINEAVRLYYR